MSDVAAKIIAEDERLRVEIDQLKHEWKKSREMLAVEQLITADRDAEIKRLCDGLLAASDIQTMGPKPGRVKRYRAGLRLARSLGSVCEADDG